MERIWVCDHLESGWDLFAIVGKIPPKSGRAWYGFLMLSWVAFRGNFSSFLSSCSAITACRRIGKGKRKIPKVFLCLLPSCMKWCWCGSRGCAASSLAAGCKSLRPGSEVISAVASQRWQQSLILPCVPHPRRRIAQVSRGALYYKCFSLLGWCSWHQI